MPKAGTYKRTPKAKVHWEVRQKPDGFFFYNRATGCYSAGAWSTYALAEKNGTLHFGTPPSLSEGESCPAPQAAEAGVGTGPQQPDPVVDVPPPSPGPESAQQTVDVPQGKVPVEGGPVAMPEGVARPTLSPQEARDLICKVFRAHRVPRSKQR